MGWVGGVSGRVLLGWWAVCVVFWVRVVWGAGGRCGWWAAGGCLGVGAVVRVLRVRVFVCWDNGLGWG